MAVKHETGPRDETALPIDTLILIGNGFDSWQELNTSYDEFEKYYHSHRAELLQKLGISEQRLLDTSGAPVPDKDGAPTVFCDVELVYGDPFSPNAHLPYEFWHRFEDSLKVLDAQRLNAYFGKEKDDLEEMERSVQSALRILRQAFCDWIAAVPISEIDAGYRFGSNCVFINFNYTDTLERRFHVDPAQVYHIHGAASAPDSIIVGHARHPEYPYPPLGEMGGRFRGLYQIEKLLYDTDKHVEDRYMDLCQYFAALGVDLARIQRVYVLGHSFGEADLAYFEHLARAMQGLPEDPEADLSAEERAYLDHCSPEEAVQMNYLHAMHNDYRLKGSIPDTFPRIDPDSAETEHLLRREDIVVRRRFLKEQKARDRLKHEAFQKTMPKCIAKREKQYYTRLYPGKAARAVKAARGAGRAAPAKAGPRWCISYYTEEDRQRIEAAMRSIGYQNYAVLPSIEKCLTDFKAL